VRATVRAAVNAVYTFDTCGLWPAASWKLEEGRK